MADATVARGDLLRRLAAAEAAGGAPTHLALDTRHDSWWGYCQARLVVNPAGTEAASIGLTAGKPATDGATARAETRPPLRMPDLLEVVDVEDLQPPPQALPEPPEARPFVADDVRLQSAPRVIHLRESDLAPRARVLPALKRWLGQHRPGGLDVHKLVEQVAARQAIGVWPRCQHWEWGPKLDVYFDFSEATWPYRFDMVRLRHWLLQARGATGLRCFIGLHGAAGEWQAWPTHPGLARGSGGRPVASIDAGSDCLLVSDLGQTASAAPGNAGPDWQDWFMQRCSAGQRVLVLAPLPVTRLPTELPRGVTLLRWTATEPWRPEHRSAGTSAVRQWEDTALANLLALVSAFRRVDPPLLRALRRLMGPMGRAAELESQVWTHPHVSAAASCRIRAEHLLHHWARFHRLPQAWQSQAHLLGSRHHQHLHPVLRHVETLLRAHWADPAVSHDWAVAVQEAERFVAAWGASAADPQDDAWHGLAEDLLRSLPGEQPEHVPPALRQLADRVFANAQGGLPAWVRPPHEPEPNEAPAGWLVHVWASNTLELWREKPSPTDPQVRMLYGPLRGGVVDVRVNQASQLQRHPWPAWRRVERGLLAPGDADSIDVQTPQQRVRLRRVPRPRGFVGAGWKEGRLHLDLPPSLIRLDRTGTHAVVKGVQPSGPDQWTYKILRHKPRNIYEATVAEEVSPTVAMTRLDWQLDGAGLYLDLTLTLDPDDADHLEVPSDGSVTTPHRRVVQRFRYLPPGTFQMGRTPNDPEARWGGELPRHSVTLNEGLWLADTPCTQALWQAVVGQNPSHFARAPDATQRPVENLSWNDVQLFLSRLKGLLPAGVMPSLPTEAEWEYACRAGKETAYHWGDGFDASRANVRHGEGALRETSVVKRYEPNAWGLHDMHGNVWEWCADGRRTYTEEAQQDPCGPEGDKEPRVLRGGSWGLSPAFARAAFRSRNHPGDRDRHIGFRLALRSPSSGPGGPGDPGAPAGGRGRSAASAEPALPTTGDGARFTVRQAKATRSQTTKRSTKSQRSS